MFEWLCVCQLLQVVYIKDISDVMICWKERLIRRDIGNYTIRNCLPA